MEGAKTSNDERASDAAAGLRSARLDPTQGIQSLCLLNRDSLALWLTDCPAGSLTLATSQRLAKSLSWLLAFHSSPQVNSLQVARFFEGLKLAAPSQPLEARTQEQAKSGRKTARPMFVKSRVVALLVTEQEKSAVAQGQKSRNSKQQRAPAASLSREVAAVTLEVESPKSTQSVERLPFASLVSLVERIATAEPVFPLKLASKQAPRSLGKQVGYSKLAVTILPVVIHQPFPSRYRKWLLDPVGILYDSIATAASTHSTHEHQSQASPTKRAQHHSHTSNLSSYCRRTQIISSMRSNTATITCFQHRTHAHLRQHFSAACSRDQKRLLDLVGDEKR